MNLKSRIKAFVCFIKQKEKIPIYLPINEGNVLADKIAIVTGGTGSIGYAIAEEIIKEGGKVIITGTNEEKLIENTERLSIFGECRFMVFDMKEISSYKERIEEAIDKFPEKRIDILINCAGKNSSKQFLQVTEEDWDDILDVNCKGMFFLSQIVAKHMIMNHIKGHILNISSASAMRPLASPYGISKWTVKGMTLGLADELIKYGITVNAIGPGPVPSAMNDMLGEKSLTHPSNPSGRYITTDEVAKLACYLVSSLGDMIVGDTVYISGGGGIISLHN